MTNVALHNAIAWALRAWCLVFANGCAEDGLLPALVDAGTQEDAMCATSFRVAGAIRLGDNLCSATPLSVAIGDFDRDGRGDLAVMFIGCPSHDVLAPVLSILRGRGDGTFLDAANYDAPKSARRLAVRDLNSDGVPDLLVSSQGTLSTFLGRGDGTFLARLDQTLRNDGVDLELADLDGDGRLDVAVADYEGISSDSPTLSSVDLFFGRGDGTFEPDQQIPAGNVISRITVGDLDGDSRPDIAIVGVSCPQGSLGCTAPAGQLLLLFNEGGRKFDVVARAPNFLPWDLAAADFDGDGIADLGIIRGDGIAILLGRADRTLMRGSLLPPGAGDIEAGDIDADGHADVIAIGSDQRLGIDTIDLYCGNGHDHFGAPLRLPLQSKGIAVAIGDLDGDGAPDLVALEGYAGQPGGVDARIFLSQRPSR